MNEEKKNQIILVSVIIGLLVLVVGFVIVSIYNFNRNKDSMTVKFKQIYSSDYVLEVFNNDYYMGLYDDKISVLIDKEGNEVYRFTYDIDYKKSVIYSLDDDRTIICSYDDEEKISLYVFSDNKVELYDVISDIAYGKPVLDKNNKLVAFVELKDDGFDLYNVSKKEVKEIKGYSLVGDYSYNYKDYCENNGIDCLLDVDIINYKVNNNSFVVKKDDKYCAIDFNGKEIIPCQYSNLLGIGDDLYIAQNSKGMYGLLLKNDVKMKFQYKVIDSYDNYYLVVDKNNKMALFDKKLNNLTGFKMNYDTLIEYNLRNDNKSIMLYENKGNVFIVNNYLQDINKTEYEKHTLYVYKDDISKYEEYGVFVDEDIYLYDKDYNLTIYDYNMNELSKLKFNATKIQLIERFSDNILHIRYTDSGLDTVYDEYFDYSGKKLPKSEYGVPVFSKDGYIGYLAGKNTLKVLYDDKVVGELKESNISIVGDQFLTKNSIYVMKTS